MLLREIAVWLWPQSIESDYNTSSGIIIFSPGNDEECESSYTVPCKLNKLTFIHDRSFALYPRSVKFSYVSIACSFCMTDKIIDVQSVTV